MPFERILLLALLPIGDTLLAAPTIRAIRDRYPHARISALAHTGSAPVLRCIPEVDEVVLLPTGPDWQGPRSLLGLLWRLRQHRYDVAVNFTSPGYKWIPFLAGVPRRTYMKFDRLWWLLPARHARWREMHAAEHYYHCASELDLPPWDQTRSTRPLSLPLAAREAARCFLAEHMPGGTTRPLVALHPGGAGLGGRKRWPAARFAALADELTFQYQARVLVLGGPDEMAYARQVAEGARHAPIVAAGEVDLLTSFALIEAADLCIGNDSSLIHAAANLGTPYVAIFGPTSTASFRPLALRVGQGIIVEPWLPCDEPTAFIGSAPIWQHPRCRGTCEALPAVRLEDVMRAARFLLRSHASARAVA